MARRRAIDQARRFGRELRIARTVAGLTQAQVASRGGVSQETVSHAETGHAGVSLEARCRMAAACGHEVALKLFPVSTVSLRDSGQLGIATALLAILHRNWQARLEFPVAPGDLRAADILLRSSDELVQIEIERGLVDLQAQIRAGQIKREVLTATQERPVRLVFVLPDSRLTRDRIRSIGGLLEGSFPVATRRVLQALRTGGPVGGDAMVLVRSSRLTHSTGTSANRQA